jgi:hypothetical protein
MMEEKIRACEQVIEKKTHACQQADKNKQYNLGMFDRETILSHLAWMCKEMRSMDRPTGHSFWRAIRRSRASRWLGFVRGALWAMGMTTIDQMTDDEYVVDEEAIELNKSPACECEHADEVPEECSCELNCYCKRQGSCVKA